MQVSQMCARTYRGFGRAEQTTLFWCLTEISFSTVRTIGKIGTGVRPFKVSPPYCYAGVSSARRLVLLAFATASHERQAKACYAHYGCDTSESCYLRTGAQVAGLAGIAAVMGVAGLGLALVRRRREGEEN